MSEQLLKPVFVDRSVLVADISGFRELSFKDETEVLMTPLGTETSHFVWPVRLGVLDDYRLRSCPPGFECDR